MCLNAIRYTLVTPNVIVFLIVKYILSIYVEDDNNKHLNLLFTIITDGNCFLSVNVNSCILATCETVNTYKNYKI